MKLSDLPTRFNIPFGDQAGGSFIRNIPQASQIGIQGGAASLTDGFPPLCSLPVGAGGVPPFMQDANGILKQITQWNRWAAAGGAFALPWNSTFATAIGGYPQGALVQSATAAFGLWWLNNTDDNATNPDAGGAGWIPIAFAQQPTFTTLTTGSGAYNPQANIPFAGAVCRRVRVRMSGGGASGGTTAANGLDGALTSFGAWTANPGIKGLLGLLTGSVAAIVGGAGGSGGTNGTGTLVRRRNGGSGADGPTVLHNTGTLANALTYGINAPGGMNWYGGGPGKTPAPNTGAGSAGVGTLAPVNGQQATLPSGGGSGEVVEFIVPVTAATIAYVVGAGGAAPSGGIAAAAGVIEIEEQYV